jgi:hypothetical protein
MIRAVLLGAAGLLSMAAAPRGGFNTTPYIPPIVAVPQQTLAAPNMPPQFEPAPTPNMDASAPISRASRDTSLSPSLFTRRDQYRGEGLAAMDSAQIEQERRVTPGAGLKLSMPLQ